MQYNVEGHSRAFDIRRSTGVKSRGIPQYGPNNKLISEILETTLAPLPRARHETPTYALKGIYYN